MDGSTFDRLVRHIGEDGSRRGLLRSALAVLGGGLGLTSLLGLQTVEAGKCEKKCRKKAKKKDWSKKKKKACLDKCNPRTPPGGKSAGTLCESPGECAAPNTCDIPVNDSGGDKRCCAPSGAPCGLKDPDNNDDTSPFCCRNLTCTSSTTVQGTCQPAP
jgi:hypothetical protein